MSKSDSFTRIWGLFASFFGISAIALGGGLVMLPMLRDSFVVKRNWLTDEEMVDTVAAMQSMPGLIIANMGALIGYRVAGIYGALAAILGGALPPVAVIALLAALISRVRSNPWVQGAFCGVRAAVAALILLAIVKLVQQIILKQKDRFWMWSAVAIASLSAAVLLATSINAAWLVVAGGLAGLALASCHPAGKPAAESSEAGNRNKEGEGR